MTVKAKAQITLSCVVDVQATYRYYLLQSSTLAKPQKPTANPPGGSWNDTEPTYTAGSTNSLYFVDLTLFSDGTFAYSSVSLSSSYEAAKAAYNKAQTAQNTADGKNAIFYQDTAPATTGRKEYDIWFDTDDDNKMYYFDGSAWTEKQFGTDAIADSTIVARLIASNTITGDKLVVDAITTREIAAKAITANELAANAVTAEHIKAGAVTADKISVDDLSALKAKIGGFSITSTKLYAGTTAGNMIAMQTGGTWAFAAGANSHSSYGDAAFRVSHAGALYATKGKIGDLVLQDGYLRAQNSDVTQYLVFRGVQTDDTTKGILYFTDTSSGTTIYPWRFNGDGSYQIGSIKSMDGAAGKNMDVRITSALFVDYGIELFGSANETGQPYIDFHYNQSYNGATDYTSRIMGENAYTLSFIPSSADTRKIQMLVEQSGEKRVVLRPFTNGDGVLGTASWRWNTGYFTNTITQSDSKTKNIVGSIDKAVDFVMSLKPYMYTLKDGDSKKRIHMGLIAQDVAQITKELDMGDLALYQAAIINEDGTESYYDESVPDEKLSWGLNYNELIAPLTAALQHYMEKVDELEKKITTLIA